MIQIISWENQLSQKYLWYALHTYQEGLKDPHKVACARYLCVAQRAVTPALCQAWRRWIYASAYGWRGGLKPCPR